MPTPRNWSNASAPCRLEWRPSRLLAGSLMLLGALGAASILGSEIPVPAAWPSALAVVVYAMWLAGRELRRPVRGLMVPAGDGAAMLDDVPMTDLDVQWRGPLAFVQWRDEHGLRQRLQFWPDTLPASDRRELRLAMIARHAAPAARSMAP